MKNKEKAITLIALIITIIVMLILVGVTINVALNGGLFQKAKTAADKTQREVEREQLISTMLGAYNSNGSFNLENVGELPDGAKWCTNEDTTYSETIQTIPSAENWAGAWVITKSNNKFYIDKDGSVLNEEPNIWVKRGLDTSKAKIGKLYEFNTITYNEQEYNFKIKLVSDGSMEWYLGNSEIDDYDPNVTSDDLALGMSADMVSCAEAKFSFYTGLADGSGYASIIFDGDTATLYIGSTLNDTTGTYTTTLTTADWYNISINNLTYAQYTTIAGTGEYMIIFEGADGIYRYIDISYDHQDVQENNIYNISYHIDAENSEEYYKFDNENIKWLYYEEDKTRGDSANDLDTLPSLTKVKYIQDDDNDIFTDSELAQILNISVWSE